MLTQAFIAMLQKTFLLCNNKLLKNIISEKWGQQGRRSSGEAKGDLVPPNFLPTMFLIINDSKKKLKKC